MQQRVLYFLTIIVQNDQESIILMPLFQVSIQILIYLVNLLNNILFAALETTVTTFGTDIFTNKRYTQLNNGVLF